MTCRNCGIEIADKALICYRCGTATTEAKFKPAARKRRSSSPLIGLVIALALLVLAALYIDRTVAGATPRLISWVAIALAVAAVVLLGYRRRR
ncbi:MAG: hypothetical protein ABI868_15105 [Acidobacteriota bacterium]